jgi:hypothetical protein
MIVQAQLIFQEADCRELPLGVDFDRSTDVLNRFANNCVPAAGFGKTIRQKSAKGLNRSRGRDGFYLAAAGG